MKSKCEAAGINVAFAYEIPGKEDFGDVDVLYSCPSSVNIVDFITSIFAPPDIAHAEPISFAYAIYSEAGIYAQVDMVHCNDLEYAKLYFSYGDANMVLGHLSKCHKISHTSYGLVLKLTPQTLFGAGTLEASLPLPTRYKNEVLLSSDMTEVLTFFGLSEKWIQGAYTSREEIISDLLKVRYFDALKFLPSTKVAKQSRSSRPFYAAFINRLQNEQLLSPDATLATHGKQKWEDLQMEALTYFNKLDRLEEERVIVRQILEEQEVESRRKVKYSGKSFVDRELANKSVAVAKTAFEAHILEKFNTEDFGVWLDGVEATVVEELLDEFLKSRAEVL